MLSRQPTSYINSKIPIHRNIPTGITKLMLNEGTVQLLSSAAYSKHPLSITSCASLPNASLVFESIFIRRTSWHCLGSVRATKYSDTFLYYTWSLLFLISSHSLLCRSIYLRVYWEEKVKILFFFLMKLAFYSKPPQSN